MSAPAALVPPARSTWPRRAQRRVGARTLARRTLARIARARSAAQRASPRSRASARSPRRGAIDGASRARRGAAAARAACPTPSRTCSTSRGCRRWPAPSSSATRRRPRATPRWCARMRDAGRGAGRRAQHGRVRLRLHHREQRITASRATRTTRRASPAAPRAAPAPRSRRGWCRSSLGSDTNGSIRVPSSLCGVLGAQAHVRPPVAHAARSRSSTASTTSVRSPRRCADLARVLRRAAGRRRRRPRVRAAAAGARARRARSRARTACASRAWAATSTQHATPPRAGRCRPRVQRARRDAQRRSCRRPRWARAAAFVITASEGGERCTCRPAQPRRADIEPLSRDRFVAGRAAAGGVVRQGAARARAGIATRVREAVRATSTCCSRAATPCAGDADRHRMARARRPARCRCAPSMGLLTQPISCIGLPVRRGADAAARRAADRRAGDCRALARGPMLPRRRRARRLRRRLRAAAAAARLTPAMLDINQPDVLAEVRAAFERYERALVCQRRRRARRAVLAQRGNVALRRQREPVRLRGHRRLPAARSPAGLARTLTRTS